MGRKTGSYNLNLNSSYMTGKALLLVILRHLVSLSLQVTKQNLFFIIMILINNMTSFQN